ncbi:MAG TPA: hypothetical protein VGE08_03935 [Steroidobacter sp.]
MEARSSLRPAGRQRPAAIAAQDCAAQWELGIQILPRGCTRAALEPFLDFLEGLGIDQRFVMALAARDAPLGRFDEPRIDRAREQIRDFLVEDEALRLRELGLCL